MRDELIELKRQLSQTALAPVQQDKPKEVPI